MVRFAVVRHAPTEWNGETANISLVDSYRDGHPRGLYLARPVVGEPKPVAGLTLKISSWLKQFWRNRMTELIECQKFSARLSERACALRWSRGVVVGCIVC